MTTETDGDGETTYAVSATSVQTSVATSVQTNEYTTTDTVTVTQSISGQLTTVTAPTTVVIVHTTATSEDPTSTTITQDSSGTASAPIRPTTVTTDSSVSTASEQTTMTVESSIIADNCPIGYYMCSAYYLGGCCRVGRNCETTSCPSSSSTAILTNGPTVIVPYTSTTTAGNQGSCASGWFSCAADAGGGCCPSGYECGPASCSATASGESDTGKRTPSSSGAEVLRWAWGFGVLALTAGVGMVWL
ncbi:hypothetical protein B0A50_04483 [Salinomyces thailandicus]|uniref:GPI anchored protein n=1 Tax=Salinomyces thailandicus TaxID=706561 RepID=A0A4U0TYM6_9PEZI|nr:hypothetical protein B0A50_04483 [Salinomyces thailandica]